MTPLAVFRRASEAIFGMRERQNGHGPETGREALARARCDIGRTMELKERARKVNADLKGHKESNGFAELIRGLYREDN